MPIKCVLDLPCSDLKHSILKQHRAFFFFFGIRSQRKGDLTCFLADLQSLHKCLDTCLHHRLDHPSPPPSHMQLKDNFSKDLCFFDLIEKERREEEMRETVIGAEPTSPPPPPPPPQSPLSPSRLPVTDPDGLSPLNGPPIFPSAGRDADIQGQVNSG